MSDDATRYLVTEQFDGVPDFSYYIDLPNGAAGQEMVLGDCIITRSGGLTDEDKGFRADLFRSIGEVTAVGAHIEAMLKRHLALAQGLTKLSPGIANRMWQSTEADLAGQLADMTDERSKAVLLLLPTSKEIREQRNDIIHGEWWLYAGVNRMSRQLRSGRHVLKFGADIAWPGELATKGWALVDDLANLLGADWMRAELVD